MVTSAFYASWTATPNLLQQLLILILSGTFIFRTLQLPMLILNERSGVFPFMGLPLEIRFEIYKLVLAPLLSRHSSLPGKERHLLLTIQHFKDEYYENLLAQVNFLLGQPLVYMDLDLEKTYKDEFWKVWALCERFDHPVSTRAYEMTFPRVVTGRTPNRSYLQWEKIPPVEVVSIRNLSNVSCQIRHELGTCA